MMVMPVGLVSGCTCDGSCKGKRYTCKRCKRFVPYCFGGAGDGSDVTDHEWCTDCWTQSEKENVQ